MNEFAELLKSLGVPTGLLLLLGFAVWQALRWLAATVVEPLAQTHIHLVESVQQGQARQQAAAEQMTQLLRQQAEALERLARTGEQSAELLQHLVEAACKK